jgi:hypothetical protein
MGKVASVVRSKDRIVEQQVGRMLERSTAYHAMPPGARAQILRDTAAVVAALAAGTSQADPYALPRASGLDLASPPPPQGGFNPESVKAGVQQVARIVKEVDFPNFVASLIQGTFHAIVTSSIEQMRAYADLVKSVAQSLTEFRDQNVSETQGGENLASRYPSVFKMTIIDGSPRVRPREGADTGSLPDFRKDLGLDDDITDLDEETIDNKLVPAVRDELARSRHQLLATMVLMGINRIIVTDGRINAKVQFQFTARDQAKTTGVNIGYQNMGQITAESINSSRSESGIDSEEGMGGLDLVKGGQRMSMPDVKVTSQTNTDSTAALQASGALFGEVSINFRSETFPLERMADTDQITRLQQAQASGRGAPLASASPVAIAPPAAAPAPASAPAKA